jgi:uncharacterized damage-inducible protein DinB
MSEEREPETIDELVGLIETEKAAFLRAVEGLSEAKLVAPLGPEGWSIRDHISHLVAWQDGITALLRREPRWRGMGLASAEDMGPTENFDSINAKIQAMHAGKSHAEVRAMLEESHARMIATLRAMQDADLIRPYSFYNPDAPEDQRDAPIVGWIAGNTFGHYQEHRPWVEALAAAA